MAHDKKAVGGSVRLVLPTAGNRAEVVSDPPEQAVFEGWKAIRAEIAR
jgi:hypothetical protein